MVCVRNRELTQSPYRLRSDFFDRMSDAATMIVHGQDVAALRILAVVMFAAQIAGCIVASSTHLMLHADGSLIAYAASLDEPWAVKWEHLATRITVYVFTALPTQLIAHLFNLSPMAIADVNGFIFYLVPALQFAACCALVWRTYPQYLIFPIVQYAISTGMGYGFPSEILIAPGFLWLALFLVLIRQEAGIRFVAAIAALTFSHELAVPAAMVAAGWGLMHAHRRVREGGAPVRFASVCAGIFAVFAIFTYVRFGIGGFEGDSNAIYVFDPRRVLDNPTMWLIIGIAPLAVYLGARFPGGMARPLVASAAIAGLVLLPLVLRFAGPDFDFEQGRYGSARTLVGVLMFCLTLVFIVVCDREGMPLPKSSSPDVVNGIRWGTPFAMIGALCIMVGSTSAFLYDWAAVLQSSQRLVAAQHGTAGAPVSAPRILTYAEAKRMMSPREARLHDRISFQWTLPYRSMVIADGGTPTRIMVGPVNYHEYCAKADRFSTDHGAIPVAVTERWRAYSCSFPPPPPPDPLWQRIARQF